MKYVEMNYWRRLAGSKPSGRTWRTNGEFSPPDRKTITRICKAACPRGALPRIRGISLDDALGILRTRRNYAHQDRKHQPHAKIEPAKGLGKSIRGPPTLKHGLSEPPLLTCPQMKSLPPEKREKPTETSTHSAIPEDGPIDIYPNKTPPAQNPPAKAPTDFELLFALLTRPFRLIFSQNKLKEENP